ncbi:hypothetical protein E2C01_007859 [Portunus trituberculatus]|uniref:RNase H type-1 domain-containing protein n=1 Tax=Portunus trituberculatus TaxID=210409 RepID=A0A5B7D3H4_PORTR|nr:hypothetical protein [Portunus trituberculatus]
MSITKLSKYPQVQAIHVYCDGSVNGRRSRRGLFIRNYISASHYTDTEVSRQLPAHMSFTREELYAVPEVLHIVAPLHKDVYFFVDSQAALYALQSTSPMDCDLVNVLISSAPQRVLVPWSISSGYPIMWVSRLRQIHTCQFATEICA